MPSTYHEPAAPRLLALIALFYLVQLFRGIANALLGAGLLGEIAVGVILGSPLGDILGRETEEVLIAVGYIGLVLIVFEGGLTLKPKSFLPLLPLALVVALLGILLPLAFTFALFSAPTYGYPSLQAFTAGSALASTSLGTTFYVLRAAGPTLGSTRVGEILKGAALIDDVIALVLLSVIQSLGSDTSTTALGWTIGRPVVASVGMAVIAPLVALYLARPLFRARRVQGLVEKGGRSAELFIGVAVLCAFLAIAYYTGTTMLLGAFLAGTFLTALPPSNSSVSFIATWDLWLVPLHEHIFVPLFFASIGFSLPFLDLWRGRRIWQGIIYSLLMALGKVLAGAPLLVLDVLAPARVQGSGGVKPAGGTLHVTEAEMAAAVRDGEEEEKQEKRGQVKSLVEDSLPAAAFLGLALVARGEIGVLVLQVAYSSSSASATSSVLSEEPYLLGIWAVALCTIVGPVAFGALCRSDYEGLASARKPSSPLSITTMAHLRLSAALPAPPHATSDGSFSHTFSVRFRDLVLPALDQNIAVPLPDHPFPGNWRLEVERDDDSTSFAVRSEGVPPLGVGRELNIELQVLRWDVGWASGKPVVLAERSFSCGGWRPDSLGEVFVLFLEDDSAMEAEMTAGGKYKIRQHSRYLFECTIKGTPPTDKNGVALSADLARKTGHLLDQPFPDVAFLFPRPHGDPLRLYTNRDFLISASPYFKALFTSGFAEATAFSDGEPAPKKARISSPPPQRRPKLNDENLDDSDVETDEQLVFPLKQHSLPAPPSSIHEITVDYAAYTTYRALLSYLHTDSLSFAPLSSTCLPVNEGAVTSRLDAVRNSYEASGSTVMPSSPRSLFRLAHYLQLGDLQKRCLEAIRHTLEPETVALELLKPSTRLYEELQEAVVGCAVNEVAHFKLSDAWKEVAGKVESGQASEAAAVMLALTQALLGALD